MWGWDGGGDGGPNAWGVSAPEGAATIMGAGKCVAAVFGLVATLVMRPSLAAEGATPGCHLDQSLWAGGTGSGENSVVGGGGGGALLHGPVVADGPIHPGHSLHGQGDLTLPPARPAVVVAVRG